MHGLQKFGFRFADNKLAAWIPDGRALHLLRVGKDQGHFNDMTCIMDLFSRIRTVKAAFHVPKWCLAPGEYKDNLLYEAKHAAAVMMGRIPVPEDTYSEETRDQTEDQDFVDEYRETRLEWMGLRIAREKLDKMTENGTRARKLSIDQWKEFIKMWDIDEKLLLQSIDKDMWHYVTSATGYGSDGSDDYLASHRARSHKSWSWFEDVVLRH